MACQGLVSKDGRALTGARSLTAHAVRGLAPFHIPPRARPLTNPDLEATPDSDQSDTELAYAHRGEPPVDAHDRDKGNYAYARWLIQKDRYAALEKEWTRSILFVTGKQWLEYDVNEGRYKVESNIPKWRHRPVTNLVFAAYRAMIAKLTKQRPIFEVIPPSTDSEDREAANLGQAYLIQRWRELKLPKLFMKLAGWILCTGNVYIDPYWNPELGKRMPLTEPVVIDDPLEGGPIEVEAPVGEDGEIIALPDGSPDFAADPFMVFEGDTDARIIPPTAVRMNPDAQSSDEAFEMFHGELWPRGEALEEWDLAEEDLHDSTGDEVLEEADDAIADATTVSSSLFGIQMGDRSSEIGERVLVLRYFRKQCDKYPEGRHWTQIGKQVVSPEEPLPEGMWPPFIHIEDVPVPGSPHAMGVLSQLVKLNREYNVFNGKVGEHNVMLAMGGKWIVATADKYLKPNTDPGQVLLSKGYAQGKPPIQADMVALPEAVYKERERILQDFLTVSGLNEIALGKKPEGVSSGRGFLVLQEAVDSVLTPTLYQFEEGAQELGRRLLVLAQRYCREDRLVKVRGQNGQWEVRSFKGADLGDSIDVQVQLGSSFPWSKAARQDSAIALLQAFPALVERAGVPGSVDPMKLARYVNDGGLQAFEPETNADMMEVDLEHSMFEVGNPEQGGAVPDPKQLIGFWQDHGAHLAGHYEFLKRNRARFDRWHSMAQQAFLMHTLMHQAALRELAASLAPAAPAGGEGGGPAGSGNGKKTGVTRPGEETRLTDADYAAAGQ